MANRINLRDAKAVTRIECVDVEPMLTSATRHYDYENLVGLCPMNVANFAASLSNTQ